MGNTARETHLDKETHLEIGLCVGNIGAIHMVWFKKNQEISDTQNRSPINPFNQKDHNLNLFFPWVSEKFC